MQALDTVLSGMVVLKLTHLEVQRLLKVLLAKEVMEHTMQAAMAELEAEVGMAALDVTQMVQVMMIKAEVVVQAEYILKRLIQTELLIHQKDNLVNDF